jgi:polysaccharide export outer membrane protein
MQIYCGFNQNICVIDWEERAEAVDVPLAGALWPPGSEPAMSPFKPAAPVLAAISALAILWFASPCLAEAPAPVAATATPAAQIGAPAVTRDDYRIGLYDVLDINVFEIDDLHRQVQVDGAGQIVLPLIGGVQAQGRTPAQLADDLKVKLESRYVNNAKVEVQVRTSQSEHVTVDGAVTEPGVYALKGRVTLMQAVAMAKGPTEPDANIHKVSLLRQVDSRWTRTEYDLAKIRSGKAEDPEIRPQDVVVVAGSHKQDILRALGNILPMALLLATL